MSDSQDESKRGASQAPTPAKDKGRVSRRQAIQTVVAGSGVVAGSLALPKRWTKPVVEVIVPPAMAGVFSPPISMSQSFIGSMIIPSQSVIGSMINPSVTFSMINMSVSVTGSMITQSVTFSMIP